MQKLLAIVQVKVTCQRSGKPIEIAAQDVVAGDLVLLQAGGAIPADSLLLEARNLFVNEATLNWRNLFPSRKAWVSCPQIQLWPSALIHCIKVHMSSVERQPAVAVHTGQETEFGKVSQTLARKEPETEFERGIRRFGYLLMQVTLLMVLAILAVNVFLGRPVLDSLLFSLALAVGLTPQLLPAIISINLAHGAKRMAEQKVIVKRLSSIENLGSMDVLCTDKTGTLTEGTVKLHGAVDVFGKDSDAVLLLAFLNATFQSGYANPIDQAVVAYRPLDIGAYKKLDEEPYDFVRKRLSVLVAKSNPGAPDTHLMVTKGALANVLEVCTTAQTSPGTAVPLEPLRAQIQAQYETLSAQGYRTLGISFRDVGTDTGIGKDHETGMTFAGFLVLFDPLQPGIVESLEELRRLGIAVKIITGDNALVAGTISKQAGMTAPNVLTGPDLHVMSQEALIQRSPDVDVFAEVEPNQKERIILALQKAGHVVGYMGDGINDASALHAADVGLSVAGAVDVAKESAAIVLLEKTYRCWRQACARGV